jgi:hypothetical protein
MAVFAGSPARGPAAVMASPIPPGYGGKHGKRLWNRPSRISTSDRRHTWSKSSRRLWPSSTRCVKENTMATPTMNRKKGKMKSVGVQPLQAA